VLPAGHTARTSAVPEVVAGGELFVAGKLRYEHVLGHVAAPPPPLPLPPVPAEPPLPAVPALPELPAAPALPPVPARPALPLEPPDVPAMPPELVPAEPP
jgi:hypothetical protein